MKKFLLLAVSAVLGLVAAAQGVTAPPSGTQVVNADFSDGGNPFTNGTIIALQCLDTNGGAGYYFNGAEAKTESFKYANLYRVVTTDNGRFKLQNVKHEDEYVGRTSNADNAPVVMTDSENAETFTAAIAAPTGWTSKPSGVTSGTNTVRFTSSAGDQFLNTNAASATPKYYTGAGGYSVWYVYKFSTEEVTQLAKFDKVFRMGQPVESIDDLTSGTYFIRAHANNNNGDMARGEVMLYDYNNANFAAGLSTNIYEFPGPTDNFAYVWHIEVSDTDLPAGATPGGKVFTVQNYLTDAYWAVSGGQGSSSYPAKGSFYKSTHTQSLPKTPGQYQLVEVVMPETHPEYYGNKTDCKRFFMQLTNAQFQNGTTIAYPFVHTNAITPVTLSYWANYTVTGTSVQFDLVKAEEVKDSKAVVVNLPALNGITIDSQTVNVEDGATAEEVVKNLIDTMGKGGFNITGITSSTGSNEITEDGQVLTVEGQWEREVVPGQVYRLRIRTDNDSYGAIRYMLSSGDIETRREGMSTLSRLVPERLWYFTVEGEGANKHYTLHTLYDTEKAVKFTQVDNTWNHATASLADEGTPMYFAARTDGDFTLRLLVDGSANAWLNDFGGTSGAGKLSVYTHDTATYINDSGSFMRVYPLTDDDYAELAGFASAEEIAAAKANPTVENVKPLIDAYNANNAEAALKRVEYIFSSGIIGPNPGQYSDASGEFAAAVEHLRQVLSNEAATPEEIQEAVAAVNALIEGSAGTRFSLNEMTSGFYRFKTKLPHGRYLSSISGGSAAGRVAMGMTDDATRSNTVFYVEAKDTNDDPASVNYNVICFDNGLVLPNLNDATSWMPALLGASQASENVNFNYKDDGTFVIHVGVGSNGGHRHMHGGTGEGIVANAGGADDDGYRWYIERVTELPITFYNVMGQEGYTDDGWSSVYSPVALEIPAEYTHTTAYTGTFDDADYTGLPDINHVLATPIEPDEDGRVIIPANQPALLFYDGELSPSDNPYLDESLMESRSYITYLHLPIVAGYESTGAVKGNLHGGFLATPKAEETDYFTLHASHSNNFREYSEYESHYTFVPGFKAYLETAHADEETVYPIYTVNPNTMVSVVEQEDAFIVEKQEDGRIKITVTTPAGDFEVYYKQSPAAAKQNGVRRAADHTGYELATKEDDVHHSFYVEPGNVDYYAYHTASDTQGVIRTVSVTSDGTTTGINEIAAEEEAVTVYDLQGRRLIAPVKGLNIINGKKVLVR